MVPTWVVKWKCEREGMRNVKVVHGCERDVCID